MNSKYWACELSPTGLAMFLVQWFWGSVPGRKYSSFDGQPEHGSDPVIEQMDIFERLAGMGKRWASDDCRSPNMICCQIGEAPVIPEATYDMEVLSLLPTHVATR